MFVFVRDDGDTTEAKGAMGQEMTTIATFVDEGGWGWRILE